MCFGGRVRLLTIEKHQRDSRLFDHPQEFGQDLETRSGMASRRDGPNPAQQ